MPIGIARRGFALMCVMTASVGFAQQKRPWKGYSILGNGNVTAVYSDDSRITNLTHATGIQHLYFRDYTADYVVSTRFDMAEQRAGEASVRQVGMKNFFTAQTVSTPADGSETRVLCYVLPADAVVLTLEVTGAKDNAGAPYRFTAQLRDQIRTDSLVSMTDLQVADGIATAVWSNGTALAVAGTDPRSTAAVHGASVVVSGNVTRAGAAEILIVPATSRTEALSRIRTLRSDKDLEATARKHWESWMAHGVVPRFRQHT